MPNFTVIFKNQDFIILDKPAGYSFHGNSNELGFAALAQQDFGFELWPVHRLDKITSGLIIFARTKDAAISLNSLFANRKVIKIYLAISDKKPKKKQGRIVGDMQKSRNGSYKLTTDKRNPAVTIFRSTSLTPGKRLFWIEPQTGKTHQIRVALKSLGAPILGDVRYAGSSSDRGYLHAYQLTFEWKDKMIDIICPPKSGEYFTVAEFSECIEMLQETH